MDKNLRKKKESEIIEGIRKTDKVGFLLLLLVFIFYFGFIFVIAFNKRIFYETFSGSNITIGIPIGVSIIFFTILVSFLFTSYANKKSLSTKEHMQALLKGDTNE